MGYSENHPSAIRFASSEIQGDLEFIYNLLQQYPDVFKHLQSRFRGNHVYVMIVLATDGHVLKYVSDYLKEDDHIARTAILQDSNSMCYLPDDSPIRANLELAKIAVAQHGIIFTQLSDDLKKDREIALIALKENGKMLFHPSMETFKSDLECMAIVMNGDKKLFPLISSAHDWSVEHSVSGFISYEQFILMSMMAVDGNLIEADNYTGEYDYTGYDTIFLNFYHKHEKKCSKITLSLDNSKRRLHLSRLDLANDIIIEIGEYIDFNLTMECELKKS